MEDVTKLTIVNKIPALLTWEKKIQVALISPAINFGLLKYVITIFFWVGRGQTYLTEAAKYLHSKSGTFSKF